MCREEDMHPSPQPPRGSTNSCHESLSPARSHALFFHLGSDLPPWHSYFPLPKFTWEFTCAKRPSVSTHSKGTSRSPTPRRAHCHPAIFFLSVLVYFTAFITRHNYITYFLLSCFWAVPPPHAHMSTGMQGSHLSCSLLCHQHLPQY